MYSVCIIEDNEQNMYLITYLLTAKKYTVYQAFNGKQGIEVAIESNPDIILLDIQLPEMDGYEVAKRLREHECLHSIPIVAVTSYAMPGDKEKALKAGCNGYIEKPINPETFIDQIEFFLNPN